MIVIAGTPAGSTPVSGTLVILGLVLACVGLFFALSHSLRTARRNLGPPKRFLGGVPGTDPRADEADDPAPRPAGGGPAPPAVPGSPGASGAPPTPGASGAPPTPGPRGG